MTLADAQERLVSDASIDVLRALSDHAFALRAMMSHRTFMYEWLFKRANDYGEAKQKFDLVKSVLDGATRNAGIVPNATMDRLKRHVNEGAFYQAAETRVATLGM